MTLSPRERWLVFGALPILCGIAVWHGLWVPAQARRASLLDEIAAYRAVAALAAQVDPVDVVPRRDAPLAAVLTETAVQYGLDLTRIEPAGLGVRVALSDARFVDVVEWLAMLDDSQAILVDAVQIERRPIPGQVSIRVTLEAAP